MSLSVAPGRSSDAYYEFVSPGRYRSTPFAQSAWSPEQVHMAPASGLLVEAIEKCSARSDLVTSRVAFDILGILTAGEVEVTARVIRPGRTIELVESEMVIDGRPTVRATAWRLAVSDTSDLAANDLPTLPGPDQGTSWAGSDVWGGGFIRTLEFRVLPGWKPGRGQVWVRTAHDLVDGVPVSDIARFFALVDVANGVAVRADPRELYFPNTDLTVHLFRRPSGEWLCLDTEVTYGADGIGLTASLLHDENGPVGRAAQTLTLRRPETSTS